MSILRRCTHNLKVIITTRAVVIFGMLWPLLRRMPWMATIVSKWMMGVQRMMTMVLMVKLIPSKEASAHTSYAMSGCSLFLWSQLLPRWLCDRHESFYNFNEWWYIPTWTTELEWWRCLGNIANDNNHSFGANLLSMKLFNIYWRLCLTSAKIINYWNCTKITKSQCHKKC